MKTRYLICLIVCLLGIFQFSRAGDLGTPRGDPNPGGGAGGGSSSHGHGSHGHSHGSSWWWSEDDDPSDDDDCNPDTSPPWLVFNMLPYDDVVDCVPDNAPDATTSDTCGSASVAFSSVTKTNAAGLPVRIVRTWTATDVAGNSSQWIQVIDIRDTAFPVIDVKSEIKVEVDDTRKAKMPDFRSRATDDFGLAYVTQTPGPGGEYSFDERVPVTLEAKDLCGRMTNTSFTVVFVCPNCMQACSPGSGTPYNGCVGLNLSLGRLADGRPAGNLALCADRPNDRLYTPQGLSYYQEANGAETIRTPDGVLRQVRSAQTLADIVPINGNGYEIRFFSPTNGLGKNQFFPSTNWIVRYIEGDWTTKYYVTSNGAAINPGDPMWATSWGYSTTGTPFVVWRIERPLANPERLVVTKLLHGAYRRYEYRYDEALNGWALNSGDGLKIETRFSVWDAAGTTRTEEVVVSNALGKVAYQEINEYRRFPWGDARVLTIQDSDGAALTNSRAYYENPDQTGKYMRRAWERNPDGNFAWYDYDLEGRVTAEAAMWKDNDIPVLESNAVLADAKVVLYDYVPVDAADDGTARPRKPRTITEQVAGVTVSKTYFAYIAAANGEIAEIKEECPSQTSAYGNVGNRRTRKVYYSESEPLWPGKVKSVEYSDGRIDRHLYERGSYHGGAMLPGIFTPGTGVFMRVTLIHGTKDKPNGTGKTTREVVVRDVLRGDLLRETFVFDSEKQVSVDWTVMTYDDAGHLRSEYFANGLSRSNTWSDCCGKGADVEVDGTTTYYEYDMLDRLKNRTKNGAASSEYPKQPNVSTRYQMDAMGNVLQETTSAANLSLTTSNEYDQVGRLLKTVDSAGLITLYEYAEGGRITTTVRPGGATEITENYPDGRTKSETGTGVVPRFYDYGVNADGSQWTMVHTGAPDSPLWEKTTEDMLGRTLRVEKPGFDGTRMTTTYEYNGKNQRVASRQWAGDPPATQIDVPALYEYDDVGNQIRTALDVNTNGIIDLAGPDIVNETQIRLVKFGGEYWRETGAMIYASATSAVAITTSVQRSRMLGEGSKSAMGEMQSVDIRGNKTRTTVKINATPKSVVTRKDVPDSSQDASFVVVNGLLQSDTTPTGLTTTFAYDALGRGIRTTDPRTGASKTHYNERGQMDYTEDAASNRTTFAYDSATGLRTGVTDALSNTVHTAYDLQGRTTNVWGATYPVAYEYDACGRMAALKTWRDPGDDPDITRWFYDEATGLLTNKVFADGRGPSYEYDAAGRLTKRIWARGVATEYAYNALGQLANIHYSDGTPDVAFTYDRLGRQLTVADGLGTRSNVYNPATLDLAAERLPDGRSLARSYDSLGRPSGISLDGGGAASYSYDAVGRFAAITSSVLSTTTAVNYAYLPKSDLLSGWSIRDGAGTNPPVVVSRAYEPRRDLVVSVVNTGSVALISRCDYVNDPLGRRVARNDLTSGIASAFNVFGYNARSELSVAAMGTNRFSYGYDFIGNREAAGANAFTNWYQANNLNHYVSILPSGEAPAYDADGNMISNGTCTFVWDAENRLVEFRSNGVLRVKNTYDYMGRRVQKATASSTNRFVYDGWNPIQEKWGNYSCSYLWGLDLSGTLQGAGGVGGLAARTKHVVAGGSNTLSTVHVFVSDANGNITDAINPRTYPVVRYRYQYDPYGNLMTPLTPSSRELKFRFSSKYCDDETGLYYYGYRFYSPSLGRWLGRDSLEEGGGLNVYEFVNNDSLSRFDILGLWGTSVHLIATRDWAQGLGYPSTAAEAIGKADETVDGGLIAGGTGPAPWGDQSYHFDRNIGVGIDSRIQKYNKHLQAAQAACTAPMDDPTTAANQLGTALHPYQDWVAHGEYGIYDDGNIWGKHNSRSPQTPTWGDVWRYPDNVRLDAVNGPNGRPAGLGMHVILANMGFSVREYAIYKPGTRRISLTRDMTTGTLKDFRNYIKKSAVPACKCRKYFGVN